MLLVKFPIGLEKCWAEFLNSTPRLPRKSARRLFLRSMIGVHAERVSVPSEVIPALKCALEVNGKGRPVLLEFICSHHPVHGGWVGRE
jgi:hypothetical protein